MQNLIRVRIADAAEKVGIGQSPLQRVIVTLQYGTEGGKVRLGHVEAAGIVSGERRSSLHHMERRLSLRPGLCQDQRPMRKIKREQADPAGNFRSSRLPAESAREGTGFLGPLRR